VRQEFLDFLGPLLEFWPSPEGQRREGFFGLKGRFRQPRPKAWESAANIPFCPERAVHRSAVAL
jgi:hypothetical protein